MSVILKYRQVNPITERLDRGNSSSTVKALETVFGKLPVELSRSHITQLKAMVAVTGPGSQYQTLLDAVLKYERIEVWAEY